MKITDYLTIDEIKSLNEKSDWAAARILLLNWAMIAAAFWVMHQWPNPITIALGALILAGRIHGLGVIMHECGHNIFFTSKTANQFMGQWLAAGPAFDHLDSYAKQHRNHHRLAGTPDDPDLPNYQVYPVSKASFRRKVIRDLTGQTGFKLMAYKIAGLKGLFSADENVRAQAKPFALLWLSQIIIFVVLTLTLSPWLYVVWLGSMMTIHMLAVRLRQVSEHAAVPNLASSDPRDNTRTTHTNWFTRLWIGPNLVNYHLEHHIAAGVPAYNLKRMHALLTSRGAYTDTRIFRSYGDVLRTAVV